MPLKNMEWLLERPIAHRGLHDGNIEIPENSLFAFRHAVEKGYPIELDVHLMADGNVAVFHDNQLDRMCGTDVRITDVDRNALAHYHLVHTAERIPLIEEVFELVAGKVPILIETKTSSKPGLLEARLYRKLQAYNGDYAVQSFNPFHMGWFAQHAPRITRGQLAGDSRSLKTPSPFKQAIRTFMVNRISRPHFIGYKAAGLPNKNVANQRRHGRPMLAWTVRSQEEYERLEGICDNIIFEGFIPRKALRPISG